MHWPVTACWKTAGRTQQLLHQPGVVRFIESWPADCRGSATVVSDTIKARGAAIGLEDQLELPRLPFAPNRFEVRPGIAMSFLDEGPRDGEVIVMLHGNPSWSYYWRHLVAQPARSLSLHHVPDHVGMGPERQARRRATRTRCGRGSTTSTRCCGTSASTAWSRSRCTTGAARSVSGALRDPSRVKRLVITNTGAFLLAANAVSETHRDGPRFAPRRAG